MRTENEFRNLSNHQQIWDKQEALRRLGNNASLLHTIAGMFIAQMGDKLAELNSALEKGDHEATRFVSHSIKGNAGDVGAVAVHKMAAELEKLAKAQNLDDIQAVMPLFTATISATLAAMGEE